MKLHPAHWQNRFASRVKELEAEVLAGRNLSRPAKALLMSTLAVRAGLRIDILSKSAALAYTVVFSLVPLVTTLLAFLTAFPGLQTERDRFMGLLSSYLLPGAVENMQEKLTEFSDRAAAAGTVSSLIFFVMVMMLFQALELAHNSVWGAARARTWTERFRVLAFFLVLGAVSTSLFIAVSNLAEEYVSGVSSGPVRGVSEVAANLLVAWGLFVLSIRFLPNSAVTWKAASVGGIAAGTAWHFLKDGFTWYIKSVASYENVYGALGAIPVFFLWVYLSFLLLLAGACVAYVAQNLRHSVFAEQAEGIEYPRGFYSLLVAIEIARSFRKGDGPPTEGDIENVTKLPAFCVSDSLAWLEKKEFALEVKDGKRKRYLLSMPAEKITLWQVMSAIGAGSLEIPEARLDAPPLEQRLAQLITEAREQSANLLDQRNLISVAQESQRRSA